MSDRLHKRASQPAVSRARTLRARSTDAERLLWAKLRSRRFGGAKVRRQMPLGPYVVDFVSLTRRVVFELDGGQHTLRRDADGKRTQWLNANGFRVVRIWNHWLREEREAVDELLWRELMGGTEDANDKD